MTGWVQASPDHRDDGVKAVPDESGQVSPIVAVLVALAMFAALGLATIGQVWVERVHASAAADAVALASAIDPAEARELANYYRLTGAQVQVEAEGSVSRVRVSHNRGHAESWASAKVGAEPTISPALIAVIARAEQLVGVTVTPLGWQTDRVILSPGDAAVLAGVAAELGLCDRTWSSTSIALALC